MRSLTVLEGGPMLLRFAEAEILAGTDAGPIAFRGDADVHAELIGPPLLDLNVMTRAPFRSRVHCASAPPVKGARPIEARYLFALSDLPVLAIERLDLARISPQDALPALNAGAALIIDILRL